MKEFKCEYYGHSMEMQNVGIKLEIWKIRNEYLYFQTLFINKK